MKKYIKYLIIAASVIGIILAVRSSGLTDCLTLSYINGNKSYLQGLLDEHYWASVAAYIALYAGLVALAVPGTVVLMLAGGFFFGVIPTVIFGICGALIGSLIYFLMVRYVFADMLREKYAALYDKFDRQFSRDGISYLLMLHFFPITPFLVINTLAGLSSISIWSFLGATALGILPVSLVYAYAGRQLHTIHSVHDVLSLPMVLALLGLAALSIIPIVLKRYNNMEEE